MNENNAFHSRNNCIVQDFVVQLMAETCRFHEIGGKLSEVSRLGVFFLQDKMLRSGFNFHRELAQRISLPRPLADAVRASAASFVLPRGSPYAAPVPQFFSFLLFDALLARPSRSIRSYARRACTTVSEWLRLCIRARVVSNFFKGVLPKGITISFFIDQTLLAQSMKHTRAKSWVP